MLQIFLNIYLKSTIANCVCHLLQNRLLFVESWILMYSHDWIKKFMKNIVDQYGFWEVRLFIHFIEYLLLVTSEIRVLTYAWKCQVSNTMHHRIIIIYLSKCSHFLSHNTFLFSYADYYLTLYRFLVSIFTTRCIGSLYIICKKSHNLLI